MWTEVNCERRKRCRSLDRSGSGSAKVVLGLKKASERLGCFSISSHCWQFALLNILKGVLWTPGCSREQVFHGGDDVRGCVLWSVAGTEVAAAGWWGFKHTEVKKFRRYSEMANMTQSPWAYGSSVFWIVAYSVKFKPLFLQSRCVKVAMWAVTLDFHDFFFFFNSHPHDVLVEHLCTEIQNCLAKWKKQCRAAPRLESLCGFEKKVASSLAEHDLTLK